jgi:uncharacterized membrane protein YjgN (DUF898 family)
VSDTPAVPLSMYRFAFTGKAAEYLGIWVVSLCPSLLTLAN